MERGRRTYETVSLPYAGQLLNLQEAAAYLNMSQSWLKQNKTIPYVRLGAKAKRWQIEDLDNFIRSGTRRLSKQ
jgi:hypothetical protein